MDDDHAVQLVRVKLTTAHNEGDALQLARALDFIPLAISQAAAYIDQSPHCSVTQYLERLHKSDKSWQSLLKYDALDLRRDKDAKHSTLLALQVTFDHIYEHRRSASDLLSLMSIFDRQSIPASLLCDWSEQNRISDRPKPKPKRHFRTAIKDWTRKATSKQKPKPGVESSGTRVGEATTEDHGFEADLKTLSNYSLISVTAEAMVFKMHRLVQLSTQAWLQACGRLERWNCRFISNINDDLPTEPPLNVEDQAKGRRIYVPALVALEIELESISARLEQASLLHVSGCFAWWIGDYANASRMLTRSLNLRKASLGVEHQHTSETIFFLACVYTCQWRLDEAEELQIEGIKATMRLHGSHHEITMWSKVNLSDIHWRKGQLKEAEELKVEVLDTAKQMLGHEHRTTVTFMSELAVIYGGQGRLKEAEKLQMKALGMLELSRAEDPETSTCMDNLAQIYEQQGRLQEAEGLYVKAIDASKRSLGDEHPTTLYSMTRLASIFQSTGRWQSSSDLIEFCAATSASVLGHDHPDTIERFETKEEWRRQRMSKRGETVANESLSVGDGEVEG